MNEMNGIDMQRVYTQRHNAFAQFEQNRLFQFNGSIFDSFHVWKELAMFHEETVAIVTDVCQGPHALSDSDLISFRARAVTTYIEAATKYAMAYKAIEL